MMHPHYTSRVANFKRFSGSTWDNMKADLTAQARRDERTPGASGAQDRPVHRLDLCAGEARGMAHAAPTSLARQLGSLFEGGTAAGLSDRQLLERFAAARDEAAFAALVSRHGPMVLGVCRQHLGDRHDAEDAFQAVFLVLARKAGLLREPELLGNWLYGVAMRTARTARTRLDRRRRTEESTARQAAAFPAATSDRAFLDAEQAEALHREIDRLPGAFRLPVVLCYFEGLTLDEAAHRLKWPVGTLRSRLARARDKLRRGLTRRGVALSTAAMAAALAPRSASASVSSLLCDSTTRAAILFAARHAAGGALAAPAAALAQEVLRTMLLHKLKLTAMSLLLIATLAAGAGRLARPLVMGDEPRMKSPPPARPSTAERIPNDANPGRMTVVGRVLDPGGKPIANARVAVLADRKRRFGDRDGRHRCILMGSAAADADGRFALEFPAIPADRPEFLSLIAAAPGRALNVIELETDAARQEASIALPPEKPVEGRLVDVQGQPAAGVVVRVARLDLKHPVHPLEAQGGPGLWPSPATTDANGRFRMLGLSPDTPATYEVEDPRYAHQAFSFHAETPGEGRLKLGATITLRPAQSVEVRVVHVDDGTPVAGARVDVESEEGRVPTGHVAHDRTDGQGRVRVVAWPGSSYRILVGPPEGEPYVPRWEQIDWPKAAVRQSVEVKLRRGTVVRGRLIEDPAGEPVDDAWVTYFQTYRNNPRYRNMPSIEAVSGPDGTFTLVVPRGPGHLIILCPRHDYVHVATSFGEMGVGIRPSFHMYPNAHVSLDIPDSEATHPLELKLRRAVTITGRVLTPDGKPVAEAFALGRSYTFYREYTRLMGVFSPPPYIAVKDGRFEITGCDPDQPGTFYFLDVKDQLGATVELSGRSAASGPVTVQLQPTATARSLLKDADGKPLANHEVANGSIDPLLVIAPGPYSEQLSAKFELDDTPGDFAHQVDLDPAHNEGLRSGPDGRVTIANLIPGARYRFRDREFTPGPGQAIDLDNIAVDRPPH
jgi:RNA polymerase sigma factor (sigma-70 family)